LYFISPPYLHTLACSDQRLTNALLPTRSTNVIPIITSINSLLPLHFTKVTRRLINVFNAFCTNSVYFSSPNAFG
jgi:hypothetical protein